MVLDMNIELAGIDEEFLDNLAELIEDTRVEYFIINPRNKEDLQKAQELCQEVERFKYTLPVEFKSLQDKNCVAIRITKAQELTLVDNKPLVIDSKDLTDEFIEILNKSAIKGVILDAKESDNRLENFAYSVSFDSLNNWTKKGITDTDYNKIALQSDYPKYSYDELFDVLLKNISDLTFRAEQSIAAGGTRTILKTFGFFK